MISYLAKKFHSANWMKQTKCTGLEHVTSIDMISWINMKSIYQLMAKENTFYTGKLPPGGLPRNNVVKITDHPNMTTANCLVRMIASYM